MMTEPTTVEFAVKIKEPNTVQQIKDKLVNQANILESNIKVIIEENEARIVITSDKTWIDLHETIESCGVVSALVGFSNQSAVGIIDKEDNTSVKGVIRFCSIPNKKGLILDGVLDGLKTQSNFLSIHEFGDLSDGCKNLGNVYNNAKYSINANELGRATIRKIVDDLNIPELIGRGICISNSQDERLACGVISRSAGIFQNFKRICLCSGKLLWDERDLQKMVQS